MNEADVKEQVIEEEHDFTVKNGEYVEVKNEEIEQKTENLLENEIKMKADEFLEDVELKPKESESKIENKMPKNYSMLKCEICQDTVPRNLLKMIRTEDEKIVLSEIFEVKGSMGKTTPYVCLSHIRKVISDNDGKLKIPITSFEHHLRAFIRRNKYSMNDSKSRKRYCHVCHTSNDCNKLYTVSSKSVRMVIMIGCILRGTHSIEQAIPFITANLGFACHSHCKKSIDTIFEYLEMDETVVKEEIIEEEFNFTFKNGEYAEVKQEEIERKPEYLLEQEIKINPSELFEADEPDDEFFEAVQLKKVSITGTTKLKCGICQKMMPKNCLKLFKSEDNKTVLAEMFKIKGFNNTKTIFVCVSHIQTIIDDYDGKWKLPKTPFEQLLRSFITQNKRMMKDMTSSRADCGIGLLPKRKIRNEPIDFSRNKNSDKFFENTELKPKKSDYKTEKEMIGAVIKEEVIEEKHDYAFKNENFVEVKQEEIEQKPEYLLEQEIKMEPIDFFDANKTDSFFDDVELNPKENYSKGEKVSAESTKFKCEICQKTMPRNLLQLIKSEDNKTVLAEMFKLEGSLETRIFYICVSHIQMIIDDNDGQLKSTSTRSEQRLRTFISTHKKLMKDRRHRKVRRRMCQVCHMAKDTPELYDITSKRIRIVLMLGCILRGTHSVEQAKSYMANKKQLTCYSHCKESIDMIFEHLGVRSIQEFSKCSTQSMGNLMDIVKNIDSNFTSDQFIDALYTLFMKAPKNVS
ncbi:hypothetical protein L5515_009380 [Caenorhabditis briggsae]|uniref:Lin-15A/B-like domain-containing protein n=1 Tax=Caenorhabditis briggsae TaxID=6238 RepID=A0AAE9F3E2_CAEBR|nr:hypothetical protein L5515_009380 [Caenorhabditis briggsae]